MEKPSPELPAKLASLGRGATTTTTTSSAGEAEWLGALEDVVVKRRQWGSCGCDMVSCRGLQVKIHGLITHIDTVIDDASGWLIIS